jgi:membrane protein YdbS with pleckstrin-like domain
LHLFFLAALFVYLRNLYIYLFKPLKYKSQSLENINFLISFVVIFYSVAGVLSLKNFIDLNLWQIIIPIAIVLFFILFQLFCLYQVKFKNNIIFSTILTLNIMEIVLISTFLPHTYSIIGLVIAIVFYASAGLSLLHLSYKLTKVQVKTHLGLSIIFLLLIFLSSRWI